MRVMNALAFAFAEPASAQFSSLKALRPMLGASVLACEMEGLPWTTAHLAKLKIHFDKKEKAAAFAGWGEMVN